MLFDFQAFTKELRETPDKNEVVEKYEYYHGIIEGDVKDQIWYKNYVSNFDSIAYKVPSELTEEFDWDLLVQLVSASFSSKCVLSSDKIPDLAIGVMTGEDKNLVVSVVKSVKELWSFQILRLYKIYIEEQINLQSLISESEELVELHNQNQYLVMLSLLSEETLKGYAEREIIKTNESGTITIVKQRKLENLLGKHAISEKDGIVRQRMKRLHDWNRELALFRSQRKMDEIFVVKNE